MHSLTLTVDGRVGDMLTINEGTSGVLVTMGDVDLETGKLVLEYTGGSRMRTVATSIGYVRLLSVVLQRNGTSANLLNVKNRSPEKKGG